MCGDLACAERPWASLSDEHDGRKLIWRAKLHTIDIVPADPLVGQDRSQGDRCLRRQRLQGLDQFCDGHGLGSQQLAHRQLEFLRARLSSGTMGW